jgi:hypothetical protein
MQLLSWQSWADKLQAKGGPWFVIFQRALAKKERDAVEKESKLRALEAKAQIAKAKHRVPPGDTRTRFL